MWKTELGRFRIVAFWEGISLLVLFFVAMPLKYIMGMPMATTWAGWIHGVLFLVYLLTGLQAALEEEWSMKTIVFAFFASLLPAGTFVFDRWLMKQGALEDGEISAGE